MLLNYDYNCYLMRFDTITQQQFFQFLLKVISLGLVLSIFLILVEQFTELPKLTGPGGLIEWIENNTIKGLIIELIFSFIFVGFLIYIYTDTENDLGDREPVFRADAQDGSPAKGRGRDVSFVKRLTVAMFNQQADDYTK